MYLKRIELQGFKTFVTRATLELSPGITAIVGPNGSGKSNVADALRWVLGEQSLRNLRGRKSQDVIWSGTMGRSAVGMAEVHITLDNSDGWLDTPFAEVTISRRALRSGDTDYLINQSRVRLRDVTDLLGKGSNSDESYGVSTDRAVLGQGAVDALLALRPSERVAVFEDAAGVRPYFQQRDDALVRLQTTRANLVRLEDIVAELGPRLPALRRASERARRFLDVQRAYADVVARWYRLQLMAARGEWRRNEIAKNQCSLKAIASLQAFEQLHARLAERTSVFQASEVEAKHLQKALRECQMSVQTSAQLLAVFRERRNAGRGEHASLLSQQRDLETRRKAAEDERMVLTERVKHSREALAAMTTDDADVRTTLDDVRRQLAEAERRTGQIRQQFSSLQSASEKRKAEASSALRHVADLTTQLQQSSLDGNRRQERLQELERGISEAEVRLTMALTSSRQADEERKKVSSRIDGARRLVEQHRAQVQASQRQHVQLAARRDALLELQHSLADTSAGTQAIWKRRAEIPGLQGLVASAFHVQKGMERAFQAILGPAFEAFLLEHETAMPKGIAFAIQQRQAAAFFAVSSTPCAHQAWNSLLDRLRQAAGTGWVGTAIELFPVREPGLPGVQHLLAPWVVVRDVPTAYDVRHVSPDDNARLIPIATLDGCSISASGLWAFGVVDSSSKLIERDRDIQEITMTLQERERVLGETAAHLSRAEDALRQLTNARDKAEEVIRAARDEELKMRSALAREQREYDQLTGEQRSAARVEQQMRKQCDDVRRTMSTLSSHIPDDEQQLRKLRSELRDGVAWNDELRRDIAARQQAYQANQVRAAVARQQLDAEGQSLARLEQSVRTLHGESERMGERARDVADQITQLDTEVLRHETATLQCQERLRELEQRSATADATVAATKRQLETDRATEDALRQDWTAAVQREQETIRLFEQSQLHHQMLVLQIQQELGMAPEALESMPDDGRTEEQLRTKRDALKQSLKQLGQVNPEAGDEYARLAERHTFLNEQIHDVRQAMDELVTLVDELNSRIARQFDATFSRTAEAFTRYFTFLFPGGEAQLLLQRGDAGSMAVDVTARLPGKKHQDLALLSGGERSLVAVALLFAMIDARPTPFCLLDEADAALDEANVERFCSLLHRLASRTQFIVITHNRATMQAAESLYGVSMGKDGTSRIVSWKLEPHEAPDHARPYPRL